MTHQPDHAKRSQLLSGALMVLGVFILFFAEDNWITGDHKRSLTLTLVGLVPLVWGLWLRRKKPQDRH